MISHSQNNDKTEERKINSSKVFSLACSWIKHRSSGKQVLIKISTTMFSNFRIIKDEYGGIFCHHLSDNYVHLSDLYVDLTVINVDLSDYYVDLSEKKSSQLGA